MNRREHLERYRQNRLDLWRFLARNREAMTRLLGAEKFAEDHRALWSQILDADRELAALDALGIDGGESPWQ